MLIIGVNENRVYSAVMDYLKLLTTKSKGRCYFFRNNNAPVFDANRGVHRRLHRDTPKGLPDIMGLYKGKFIGIEVKTEHTKLTQSQKVIKAKIENANGIFITARSIEDVQKGLAKLDEENKGQG